MFFEADTPSPQSSSADGILSRVSVSRNVNTTSRGIVKVDAYCFTFRGVEFFIHHRLARVEDFKPDSRWLCSHGPTGQVVFNNRANIASRTGVMRAAMAFLDGVWVQFPRAIDGQQIVNP